MIREMFNKIPKKEFKMKKLHETITAENWAKRDYGIGQKRKCLSGHSISMKDGYITHSERMREIAKAISILFPKRNLLGGGGSLEVMIFNDHSDTTIEDIIRVCKMADV